VDQSISKVQSLHRIRMNVWAQIGSSYAIAAVTIGIQKR
jgi:hypothetical protein